MRDDQAESLTAWAEYLSDEENGHIYPDWFKVYAWESLKSMGDLDRDKSRFKKRTRSTTAPWPELNPEALAYTYEKINSGVIQGESVPTEKLKNMLNSGNFSKLYAHAMLETETSGMTPELREITKGSWVKYDQNRNDSETAEQLSGSLKGWNTGWCTAGASTAKSQLEAGDFYVYYTEGHSGNDNVPRVAIRMEDGQVAEVRGIEENQNLEGCMTNIVEDKLATLPGGGEYFKKVEDMRRLTEIDNRVANGGDLTAQDLVFLRFSGEIKGFGYGRDPRIERLLEGRDSDEDLDICIKEFDDIDNLVNEISSDTVADNLDKLLAAGANVDKLVNRIDSKDIAYNLDQLLAAGANIDNLVNEIGPYTVADNLDKLLAAGANVYNLANKLELKPYIIAKKLDQLLAAGANIDNLVNEIGPYTVADNLDKFLAAGANVDNLVNKLKPYTVANNLDQLLAAGANIDIDKLVNELGPDTIAKNLDQLLDAGANPDNLLDKLDTDSIVRPSTKLRVLGIDQDYILDKILKKIDN